MKRELNELKAITEDLIKGKNKLDIIETDSSHVLEENDLILGNQKSIESQETLSLFDQEKILIEKCLKNIMKQKRSSEQVFERTLYRKIKELEYDICSVILF